MIIRQYQDSDKINMRHICIVTAGAENATESEKKFFTSLYCDYYIENEPQNCFVLANENDEAVGYVICAENFKRFIKKIKPYQYKCKSISLYKYLYSLGEVLAHLPASNKAEAHLHIDILPEYQGKGYGSMLLDSLKNHLKSKKINGVMLVVSNDNKGAIKFYKKNNFKSFLNFGKGILMVCDLNE